MPANEQQFLSGAYAPIIEKLRKWQRNFRVIGADRVENSEDHCTISLSKARAQAQDFSSPSAFPVRITGSTQDGSNLRWKYSWVEVEKSASGYGGWTTLVGGRGGTANLFNGTENMNGATGLMGNGVTLPISGTTFMLLPAPTGVVVRAVQVTLGDGTIEYWFNYENGVGGGCS